MTFVAWFLEFVSGFLILLQWWLIQDEHSTYFLVLLDILLRFIVIPGSYTLNTDVIKALVVADGWCNYIWNDMPSNKVVPSQHADMEMQKRSSLVPSALIPIPRPITTISGNIAALRSIKERKLNESIELQNIFQCINRQHITSDLIIFLNLSSITIE